MIEFILPTISTFWVLFAVFTAVFKIGFDFGTGKLVAVIHQYQKERGDPSNRLIRDFFLLFLKCLVMWPKVFYDIDQEYRNGSD